MIDALAAHGADKPLDVGVLPRGARRVDDLDAHGLRRRRHGLKREISVVNEIPRRLIPRKRFAELLRGPGGRWMSGHGDMHDSPALMRKEDEHEQQATR